jgi:hypothetical protein
MELTATLPLRLLALITVMGNDPDGFDTRTQSRRNRFMAEPALFESPCAFLLALAKRL